MTVCPLCPQGTKDEIIIPYKAGIYRGTVVGVRRRKDGVFGYDVEFAPLRYRGKEYLDETQVSL